MRHQALSALSAVALAAGVALLAAHAAPTAAGFSISTAALVLQLDDALPRLRSIAVAATGGNITCAAGAIPPAIYVNGGDVRIEDPSTFATHYTPLESNSTYAQVAFTFTAAGPVRYALGVVSNFTMSGTISLLADQVQWTLEAVSASNLVGGVNNLTLVGWELLTLHEGDAWWRDIYARNDWAGTDALGLWTSYFDQSSFANTDQPDPAPAWTVFVGGWTAGGGSGGVTGAAVLSSQRHLPFLTQRVPLTRQWRTEAFTVASRDLDVSLLCGSQLPLTLSVGVYGDLNADGAINEMDTQIWIRRQAPDPHVLYRTSFIYKLGVSYDG
jgi:hypothetical protein